MRSRARARELELELELEGKLRGDKEISTADCGVVLCNVNAAECSVPERSSKLDWTEMR